ncbi:hypothetical protein QVD17_00895 [Tagetes erecta]|uniref:Uncharacterized protein n=1 Tax=Tagetes erecta TaxID=13708 RepID=A0AAD8P0Z3_TARER|nr:hypothetical protein QVD17_00895 [Tagetes erecta]
MSPSSSSFTVVSTNEKLDLKCEKCGAPTCYQTSYTKANPYKSTYPCVGDANLVHCLFSSLLHLSTINPSRLRSSSSSSSSSLLRASTHRSIRPNRLSQFHYRTLISTSRLKFWL